MNDAVLTLALLVVVVVLFLWNRLPVEVVAIGSALALYFVGLIDFRDVMAGFGDPTVIFIAALFVVSEGLDATGVTTWIGQQLVTIAGDSRRRLLLFTMMMAAGLTALININGAVAALLPMAVVVAVRQRQRPSQLLMPLAFAASAGSLVLLTGSPVNVIIADAAADAGGERFGFAEFALVGVPLTIACIAVMLLVSGRLLPKRDTGEPIRDLSRHAETLATQYAIERFAHLRIGSDSTLVGRPRDQLDLSREPGLNVITVVDGRTGRPTSSGHFVVGDRLTMTGRRGDVEAYALDQGLSVEDMLNREQVTAALIDRDHGIAEVVVPPRSRMIGEEVRPGHVTAAGWVVLAVQRQGLDQGSATTMLQVGDTMLVEGRWEVLDASADDADVLVVDAPDLVRRQSAPLGGRSVRAIVVLLVMFLLLATGLVPPAAAALLAAGAMVILRVVAIQQAYRRIPWSTVLLVAGMLPMSTAIAGSGAGELVASLIVGSVADLGPYALLAALFVVTLVFGQLISNTATALVMIPIAVSAAQQLDLSPEPVLMSLCVAAAAAFLTPIATPANMMVMGPAGYRFGDYWKLGLPLVGVFFLASVFWVPLFWHF
jgi:di/tricarboxylate transporter